MKILIVITGLSVGGAERLVTQFADAFANAGNEVVLAWLGGEPQLFPTDSRVRMFPLKMAKNPLDVTFGLWRLRRLIKEFAPDVINTHLVHANLLTRLLRVTVPMRRLVSSAHNTNEGSWLRMLGYRVTDSLADISTNVAEEAVQAFITRGAVRSGRMVLIENGIDAEQFVFSEQARGLVRRNLGLGDQTPLLLAVGRLCEQKDYPNLLRAFAKLGGSPEQPCLLIAGDGPLRPDLEKLSEALGIAERVYFLGIRHDVCSLMSATDLFVLSSAWEGLPVVLLEAMACERMVVATDSGGVSKALGSAGFLVPPRDCETLANELSRALNLTASDRFLFGLRARERVVDCFSIEAAARRYLDVFAAAS